MFGQSERKRLGNRKPQSSRADPHDRNARAATPNVFTHSMSTPQPKELFRPSYSSG